MPSPRKTTARPAAAPASQTRPLRTRRSWSDKVRDSRPPVVTRLETAFADLPAGCQMLIASPALVDAYLRQIPSGTTRTTQVLRADLAAAHGAEHTCPLTTGIFLRIVAEAAWEQLQGGKPRAEIAPFWRVIDPDSKAARKLPCGPAFIVQQRQIEARSPR